MLGLDSQESVSEQTAQRASPAVMGDEHRGGRVGALDHAQMSAIDELCSPPSDILYQTGERRREFVFGATA